MSELLVGGEDRLQNAVGPEGLLAGAGERRTIKDGGDEVFNARIVVVGVGGQRLFYAAKAEDGAAERVEIEFTVGSDDAKLVALDMLVTANIDSGMDALGILDEDGG